jgi:type IV pilus assembly protein PilM
VVEESRAADKKKPFLIGAAAILLAGVGAWAAGQHLAASKGAEKELSMSEAMEKLAPLKGEIETLLKKEDDTRKIASGYTSTEENRVYWMDLLSEVRGAFASDLVWLTDFEPIANYDPLATGKGANGKVDRKFKSGSSLIKQDFTNVSYGNSALNEVKSEVVAKGAKGKTGEVAVTTANAIRVKGFWRDSPKGPNVVSELLKNLKEKSTKFNFKSKDDKGKEVILADDKILVITVAGAAGELGVPFEITLPLAREVSVK